MFVNGDCEEVTLETVNERNYMYYLLIMEKLIIFFTKVEITNFH